MKYKNAKGVLPKELIKEVQQYIQGEYLYIPKAEGSRKKWGDNSGYRRELSQRNDLIRQEFQRGSSIEELAEAYYLSINTIKKIVYGKKKSKEKIGP